MTHTAITVSNLSKEFQIDQNKTASVLKNISLQAHYNEFTSILGISGSGKSTLLKCISSLLAPSSGSVHINGLNPYKLRNSQLAKLRRKDIAFIFQSYNLLPALPVLENIAIPLRLSHRPVDTKKIHNLLSQMKFQADAHTFVKHLSGGEQQKVAIARAILSDSSIIFADEPTGALDSHSRQIIFDLLKGLAKAGKCVLMVTHDLELASQTDRALVLKDGQIVHDISSPSPDTLYQALGVSISDK
ncbi:ABC transporter ATP-binding protein [Streptococcus cuniculi]|uniref:ABC transporter ATP-binding protein n=1 Tax=Streptococcus cuniculi TaxID=1432788 RepID=A0A4Y9JB98_9STRE|nr:ABC transporter ATP-binding protein [Streptococcus cuniculi]MBF0778857.1 ABC transporter ATP-binding protein [Streptococcus cuniculi]TFU97239.1 ABC transporter ATP-binding protein [Streptococcus cuniculi]